MIKEINKKKNNNKKRINKQHKKEIKKEVRDIFGKERLATTQQIENVRSDFYNTRQDKYNSSTRALTYKKFDKLSKAQEHEYYRNLMFPWTAKDARLPRMLDIFSNTAQPRSIFRLSTNALGNMMIYFDPNFTGLGTYTGFSYCNDVTLDGQTLITTGLYKGGPATSAPTPPANTALKCRLVSAAINASVKLSSLNNVGTIVTCHDYGDYSLIPVASAGTNQLAAVQQYTVFSNAIQGNGAHKVDVRGDIVSTSMKWFPVDPLSAVFVDVGEDLIDNAGHEAGGSPRLVFCFESLNNGATTVVEFEIVWNIEYLPTPAAKPWVGVGSQGPSLAIGMAVQDRIGRDVIRYPNRNVGMSY
jgi:hypothetical protein